MIDKNDQRKFLRLECLFNVEVINLQQEDSISGIASNISAAGVCIMTDKPLPGEISLFIKFHFPDRKNPYNIEGKAVWTKPADNQDVALFENGIEFLEINRDLKETLKENIISLHLQLEEDY